jgi:phosphoribosylformimino-5-aminoimidazole carboxamide ribotide isomerase
MVVIPAIDLKDGRCVRLKQGDFAQVTVFSEHPLTQAAQFVEAGSPYLHLVDLDGARLGVPQATAIFQEIQKHFPELRLQVGGGLREASTLENLFHLGVTRAIVGSRAVREPAWLQAIARQFPGQILLGLDAKQGQIAVQGWQETLSQDVESFVKSLPATLPLAGIIYTDISRDGMLSGVNLEQTQKLAALSPWPVYASGGVGSLEDIKALAKTDLAGVIVGRALYEGRFSLAEALAVAQC